MTSFRVFGPDETASNRLQAIYEVEQEDVDGRHAAGGRRRRRALARRARHGDAVGAHAPGLAGGLSAHRPARLLPHLRSLRPRHRLDVQPACEMAGHLQEPRAVARVGGIGEHPAVPRPSGARITTASPTRTRASSIWSTNKGPSVVRIYLPPDANTLLAVADHCLRSNDCINVIVADKQKHLQFVTIGRGHRALREGDRASGRARAPMPATSRTSCWRAAATSPRWRRWPRRRLCASELPDLKLRFVNVVDLFKLQPDPSIRTARPTRVRQPVHQRQADHLQLPRVSLADPPARVPLQGPRRTCTSAATKRKGTSTRRSSWRCSTRRRASIWSSTSSIACRSCARRLRT